MITTAPCVGSRKTPPGKRAGYAEAMPPYSPTAADRAQRRAFAALLALPQATKRRVAGRPLVIDDGALDVDIQVGLKILSRTAGPELEERTVASARAVIEQESWLFAGRPSRVGEVRDLTVPTRGGGVPARLYRPAGVPAGKLPLLIWFHGGGWVVGSIDSHDHVARAFCARAEVAVLNVGYRLAPEHPFPAGVEDAIDSFRWSHAAAAELGVDPTRIAVAGDSAGSNLAAVVSWVTTRDGGPAPAYQLLFAPATDVAHLDTTSYGLFHSGYFLTRTNIDWYIRHYLGNTGDPSDPLVSPLLAEDLSGLPPTHVAVAGFDVLRDEGEAYAARLAAAGVPVSLRRHRDAVHPFINILVTDLGQRALHEAVGALRVGLRISSPAPAADPRTQR